jgi:acetolactate decarboxylase
VDPAMKTPFAVMIFFEPTLAVDVDSPMDLPGLAEAMDGAVPSRNVFYALKAEGRFEQVRVRSVRRQAKPYPPMVEAVADQPVFDHRDIDGTLVGFRFPDYTQGLNVPGYHLHFLSRDRGVGGHVTGFSTSRARVGIDVTSQFHMALPHDVSFLDADLAKDSAEAIRKVEK